MGRLMIINGSPRAPISNSKRYAEGLIKQWKGEAEYFAISKNNAAALCAKMKDYSDVVFVFPLYADGIPAVLLSFLKALEQQLPENRPVLSVMINCGFIEHTQNNVAIQMMQLFCKQNGFPFGSVLSIGSGEAILDTPFKWLVMRKIKKLADCIEKKQPQMLQVTMPISRSAYIKASTRYWVNYGKKNGITKEQMETLKIEC